jgi:predicted RNA-binding Zn ribbon-like protein
MTTIHRSDHDHALDLEQALDFLNTRELVDGRPVDHLVAPVDASDWFVGRGVLHADADPFSERDLAHIRVVRDALRAVVDGIVAGMAPRAAALEVVNGALAVGRTARLEVEGQSLRVGHAHRTDAVGSALAAVVEPIAATLAEHGPDRFRVCANDGCRWTFYDTSRTARRRWCDMRTCGNRAKAARHRARAKERGLPEPAALATMPAVASRPPIATPDDSKPGTHFDPVVLG